MVRQKKQSSQERTVTNERVPRIRFTREGGTAFEIGDPLVRLIYSFGSFLPGNETYYGTPEEMMQDFLDVVEQVGKSHPLLALQYAAWQRDPREGKGNRSQPPWVLAGLAKVQECLEYPRFIELVAKCVVRPDDVLGIAQAAALWLGDNRLPYALKKGLALGLEQMSDYQLAKYANAQLNLLPEKREKVQENLQILPNPVLSNELIEKVKENLHLSETEEKELEKATSPVKIDEKIPQKTLRLVDVLGICKHELSPRLFLLYRYLHAPTRQQKELLPLLKEALPLFERQKELRMRPPRTIQEVEGWFQEALEARMTMEQMLSCTGMATGQRKSLRAIGQTDEEKKEEEPQKALPVVDMKQLAELKEAEVEQREIQGEIWRHLMTARVHDEEKSQKELPLLGDVAFLRNVRAMHQAGLSIELLKEEANKRRFTGIWPFQLLSAARQIEEGVQRKHYSAAPHPQVLPVLETIFERIALTRLPRKENGEPYRMLGLADVSGSMSVKIGGPLSKATCMDVSLAFSVALSYTTRTEYFGGLSGTWDNTFHPVVARLEDTPWQILGKVKRSGGWGGTQIFGSIFSLIDWLQDHAEVPRPEVLVILSDMQFHPAKDASILSEQSGVPTHYRKMMNSPHFQHIPPLAAAIVLYREILQQDVSVVIWNLAAYQGSPVPSQMERVLLMSGFDANSLRIIESWLRAGSPGTAMPVLESKAADSGESNSSFEAVLAALKRY